MKNKKVIPKKNYFILVGVLLAVVILTLYINAWVKTYKEHEISVSPFSGEVEEVNVNEMNTTFQEMNEFILYVGYTNDKTVYESEKSLLNYIKKENLVNKFIYVNVTDYLDGDEYKNILKDTFSSINGEIGDAPILMYVKDGVAEKVINSKDKKLYTYDIASLNDLYELSE